MKKIVYLGLGMLTFVIGTIGIFLPVLPTAVFYLLTAFFWLRSSTRLHQKLVHSKSYQYYVEESLIQKKITNRRLLRLFVFLFFLFLIPGLLVNHLWMRLGLAFIYICHVVGLTWYLKGKESVLKSEKSNL